MESQYIKDTLNNSYESFNKICGQELSTNKYVSAQNIFRKGCTFPVTSELKLMTLKKGFVRFNLINIIKKMGVYILWVDNNLKDGQSRLLNAVYVGKGQGNIRVNKHQRKKFPKMNFYVTFYECENRLAKYFEQLFLDEYSFDLNKYENKGKSVLELLISEDQAIIGNQSYLEKLLPIFENKYGSKIIDDIKKYNPSY